MKVEVVALEQVGEDTAPLEAILRRSDRASDYLIHWWGGYAWEKLDSGLSLEGILGDPTWVTAEIELPRDWEEGYLERREGQVYFRRGRQPPRKDWVAPRPFSSVLVAWVRRLLRLGRSAA